MHNVYCLFKGKLKFGVPYLDGYNGDPHYVIVLEDTSGNEFKIVTNVKSDSTLAGEAGYHVLYYWDQYFNHPMLTDLSGLAPDLYQRDFPTLDYVHDSKLLDLSKMRPITVDTQNERSDINDLINRMLKLNMDRSPVDYEYHGKSGSDPRKGWSSDSNLMVYGFGFLFEPQQDGLHETHMNQGNPRHTPQGVRNHSSENGIHQDGGVLVEIDGKFQALFTAFQTQMVPTDNKGVPTFNARPILD